MSSTSISRPGGTTDINGTVTREYEEDDDFESEEGEGEEERGDANEKKKNASSETVESPLASAAQSIVRPSTARRTESRSKRNNEDTAFEDDFEPEEDDDRFEPEEEDDFENDDEDDLALSFASTSIQSGSRRSKNPNSRHFISTRDIMTSYATERERVKEKLLKEKRRKKERLRRGRHVLRKRWNKRMDQSPYTVDLVAESQRIEEETRVRQREEQRRRKRLEKRKAKVKNDIILKALAEDSDLLSLREEKRAIMMEEMRIKALLDLEKTKLRRKQDLLAAQRAERKRHEAKIEHRRQKYNAEMDEIRNEEMYILKEKFGMV
eukprot:g1774.t1